MPPRLSLYSARSLLRSTCQCHTVTPSSSSSSQLVGDYALRRRSHKKRALSSLPVTRRTSAHRLSLPVQQRCPQHRLNSSSTKSGQGNVETDATLAADAEGGDGGKDPGAAREDTLPHASEEAAEIAKIMEKKSCAVGGDVGGPELEQGTPVMDMLKRDKDALKNMPKVLRDRLERSGEDGGGGTNGSRSFSTSARQFQQQPPAEGQTANEPHTTTPASMSQQARDADELLAEKESELETSTDQVADMVASSSESDPQEQTEREESWVEEAEEEPLPSMPKRTSQQSQELDEWFSEDEGLEPEPTPATSPSRAEVAEMIAAASGEKPLEGVNGKEAKAEGLKFDAPIMPLPRTEHLRRRYDPVVDHFTKMIMWHGKLAQAQKHMSMVLDILRTAPLPNLDPRLLPNPGADHMPLNPIAYLTLVVDSVAPLLKIRQQKGAAGGGKALPIPRPLSARQRRRIAIQWIVNAAEKRRDPQLPNRLAQEIIAVAEGRSSIWARRAQLHKEATAARVNVNWSPARVSGGRKCGSSPRPLRAFSTTPPSISRWVPPQQQQTYHPGSPCSSSNQVFTSTESGHRNNSGRSLGRFPDPELDEHNSSSLLCVDPPSFLPSSISFSDYGSINSSFPSNGHTCLESSFDSPSLSFPQHPSQYLLSSGASVSWSQFFDFGAGTDSANGGSELSQQASGAGVQDSSLGDNFLSHALSSSEDDILSAPFFSHSNAQDSHSYVTSGGFSATTLTSYDFSSASHSSNGGDPVLSSAIAPGLDTHTKASSTQRSSPCASTPSSSSTHAPGQAASRVGTRNPKSASTSTGPRKGVSSTDDAAADKRRRNTLAARRFRQKQHDRVSQLEQALEQMSKERDDLKMQVARWEGEATALRAMLAERSSK